MKKIQIQILYKNHFIGLIFFLFLCGCTKGPYPNLNECPKFQDAPTVSFTEVDEEIYEMKKEIDQTKQRIKHHNASV